MNKVLWTNEDIYPIKRKEPIHISSFISGWETIQKSDLLIYVNEDTGEVICFKNRRGKQFISEPVKNYTKLQKFIKKLFKI